MAYFEELLVEHYSTDLFHCFLLMTSVKQFSKFVVIASVNFPVHVVPSNQMLGWYFCDHLQQ